MKKPLLKISVACSDNVGPCIDISRYEDKLVNENVAYKNQDKHEESGMTNLGCPWLEEYAAEGYGEPAFYEAYAILHGDAAFVEVKQAVLKSIALLSLKTKNVALNDISDEMIEAALE